MANLLAVETSLLHSLFHPVVSPASLSIFCACGGERVKAAMGMRGSIQETIREADELYSKRERRENVRASVHILRHVTAGTAVKIKSSYHAAGPLRALGRMEHKLPRWLGGERSRARANFEKAIAIAPENTVTRIYFAELLLELGEKHQVRAQLKFVLNCPSDQRWEFEIERDKQIAKEMLARMESTSSHS